MSKNKRIFVWNVNAAWLSKQWYWKPSYLWPVYSIRLGNLPCSNRQFFPVDFGDLLQKIHFKNERRRWAKFHWFAFPKWRHSLTRFHLCYLLGGNESSWISYWYQWDETELRLRKMTSSTYLRWGNVWTDKLFEMINQKFKAIGRKYQVLLNLEVCCRELRGIQVTSFCACVRSFCSVGGRLTSQEDSSAKSLKFMNFHGKDTPKFTSHWKCTP